jgi:hypothetical protein
MALAATAYHTPQPVLHKFLPSATQGATLPQQEQAKPPRMPKPEQECP